MSVTGLAQQAEPNRSYLVEAASAGNVVVTLPPNSALNAGDTVGVRGISANDFVIAQNAGQFVDTTNLPGNVAPGANWTPRLEPQTWHWIASNGGGDILVSTTIPGNLRTSVDGGANWTTGDSTSANWISADSSTNGERMVAVAIGGGMVTSIDRGVTWTPVTGPAGNDFGNRLWESVTISGNGERIAAVVLNGPIYVSQDSGASWTTGVAAGGTATLTSGWRNVDSSADGQFLVAVSQATGEFDGTGEVYTSADFGATWTLVTTLPANRDWYRTAISDDGQTIAVGGRIGSEMFVSSNGGTSWTQASTPVGRYTAITMSANGQVIGATLTGQPWDTADSTGTAGGVFFSTGGAANFSALTLPGADTNWRAYAVSDDGNRHAVAAGTFFGSRGQMYTSAGNRTNVGTTGSITGNQNEAIELQYEGNGRFTVRSNTTADSFVIQ